MKISELLAYKQDIDTICKQNPTFPTKITYTIAVNKKRIIDALIPFGETQKVLFAKYADGNTKIETANPNYQKFIKELDSLLEEDVDVEIGKFSIDDLKVDEIDLETMNALMFMVE